jgi:hypothetical protein
MHFVDPVTGKLVNAAKFSSVANSFVSSRPIWLVDAARPLIA